MIARIYGILEGEVISVQEHRDGERSVILYTCLVQLPNGTITPIPNCKQSAMFGGIGDYERRRLRAREDSEYPKNSFNDSDLDASVGERVYITFIGGSIYKPVIIGYADHPNQVIESEDAKSEKPNRIIQYLGIRETIDGDGNWRFVRKGAPNVTFQPQGTLSSLSSFGSTTFPGDDSSALEPKGDSQRFVIEILDNALLRMRDPKGGMIEFDHKGKSGIYISDNDFTSLEDVDESSTPSSGGLKLTNFGSPPSNDTDAEYIYLNRNKKLLEMKAREKLVLFSGGQRFDIVSGKFAYFYNDVEGKVSKDRFITINGSDKEVIEVDKDVTIKGNVSYSIDKKLKFEVNDSVQFTSSGKFEINTKDNLTLYSAKGYELKTDGNFLVTANGGAKLSMTGGKIAFGNTILPPGAVTGAKPEIMDILEKLLNLLAVEMPAGFGVPLNGAPQYQELALLVSSFKDSL